jgi:anaerobic ribonucleoside-triphosphate reductase activating protein
MRIAGLVQDSIVDGPGLRFSVFTQGCPHHCEGCHNPETHDPNGGSEMAVEEVIRQMLSNPLTDGVTLTGGEPFFQPAACAEIAEAAKKAGLNVWAYTGYTFEYLFNLSDPNKKKLLILTDVLVDGRFILAERSLSVKWRGSRNQRLIDVKKSLAEGKAIDLI